MSAPLDGSIIAVEFLHARPESEAQELVSELGGESRRGVSKTTTHYVTDQSNVSQLARATRLGVHCVTIDWLLQCKKSKRFVAVEPYLIDVSEFTAERPSLAVPDSDVYDDVLDKVADDQVPAALSESTATSTTGRAKAASTTLKSSSAKRDSAPSIAVAQPMPTTAELLALDASPPSNRSSSRRATASRHNSLERARSPSATLELKAPTPVAAAAVPADQPERTPPPPTDPVAVPPPASIVAAEPQSLSKLASVSKISTKRSSSKFKPPTKRINNNSTEAEADAFEFDGDNAKQAPVHSSSGAGKKKAAVAAAAVETIDLLTAESSSLEKKPTAAKKRKETAEQADEPAESPVPKKARGGKAPKTPKTPTAASTVTVESSAGVVEASSVASQPKSSTSKRPTKKGAKDAAESPKPATRADNNNNNNNNNNNSNNEGDWLSASSVSVVFTGGGDATKRLEEKAKLLGVHVSGDVTTRTTHVVLLSELRTMKVLLGIAQRLWLVEPKWLDDGDEKRGLPVSQAYEVASFAGARRARTGAAPPLDGVSVWFAGTDTQPPMKDLKQLLKLAGGKAVASVGKADVVIAGRNSTVWHRGADDEKPVVKENWLLNCVSSWAKEPFEAHFAREVEASETV